LPTQGDLLTAPLTAGDDVVSADLENILDLERITVTRSGVVTHLGAVLSADPLGPDVTQPGRFVLYSDNGAGTAPLNLIGRSVEGIATNRLTLRGVRLAIDATEYPAPINLAPGFVWVGLQTGINAGTGQWEVRGDITPGSGVGRTGRAVIYPAAPPSPWTNGGSVAVTFNMAMGLEFTAAASSIEGSVVGEFIVGDGTLVGEPPSINFNESDLFLQGKAFIINILNDLKVVTPGKPKMFLNAKAFTVKGNSAPVFGKSSLILQGKTVQVIEPVVVTMGKPVLLLNAKAFVLQLDSTMNTNKAVLYLLGKAVTAAVAGLVPSVPENVNLVPTVDREIDLIESSPSSLDLVPTVEEYR
jgi:hypothetical protein